MRPRHTRRPLRVSPFSRRKLPVSTRQKSAAQRQLPDVKARIEKDRGFERTLEELSGLTARLDAERATADQLQEELANLESQLHGEQRTVAMLREARWADAEQARQNMLSPAGSEAECACFAEPATSERRAERRTLALERTAFAELTGSERRASSRRQVRPSVPTWNV